MKVTVKQSILLSFLGFSWNASRQNFLVYHILILIRRGTKLYSQTLKFWVRVLDYILTDVIGF